MKKFPGRSSRVKEIVFYALGVVLIAGFVLLYFPRFVGVVKFPPVIRWLWGLSLPGIMDVRILPLAVRIFLVANWATIWTIIVNAGVFILFLAFLPYRARVEWRTKGLFSAFILALMAEMFGIPLLLYLLSPLMRINYYWKHPGGWLNNPLIFGVPGAIIGAWLTLIGMVIVFIGWQQIHRGSGLVTTGIYKYVRHPQYTGFFLVMSGWLLQWETTLTLIIYPVLVVMYFLLARREEAELKRQFGEAYMDYRQKTPMFWPFPRI
jgi:methanethiol S-methyltransferase